jgi:hypothetical protein
MDNKFLVWDLNQLALFSAPQSKVLPLSRYKQMGMKPQRTQRYTEEGAWGLN